MPCPIGTRTTALSLAVCLCLPGLSLAAPGGRVGGLVSVSSNYFYWGYTKSGNDPTVRANLDYEHDSGLYLGTWVSWVDFKDTESKDRSSVEFYPYLGFNYRFADDWRTDISVARYIYDAKIFGQNSDYNQYVASLSYKDLLTASFSFSDSYFNRGNVSTTEELKARYPINAQLEISGGVGYNQSLKTTEYNTLFWDLGMSWFFYKHMALDLRYVDFHWTDFALEHSDTLDIPYDNRHYLLSLSVGF